MKRRYTFEDFKKELAEIDYEKLPLLGQWAAVFEKIGCISCHSRTNTHAAYGFCLPCVKDIVQKMTALDEGRLNALRKAYDKLDPRR